MGFVVCDSLCCLVILVFILFTLLFDLLLVYGHVDCLEFVLRLFITTLFVCMCLVCCVLLLG